jgi:hypothetical protein
LCLSSREGKHKIFILIPKIALKFAQKFLGQEKNKLHYYVVQL